MDVDAEALAGLLGIGALEVDAIMLGVGDDGDAAQAWNDVAQDFQPLAV